jgi:hypothetical protein
MKANTRSWSFITSVLIVSQVPEANFRSGTRADKIASLKVLKREKLAVLVVAMWQIYANKKGAAFMATPL